MPTHLRLRKNTHKKCRRAPLVWACVHKNTCRHNSGSRQGRNWMFNWGEIIERESASRAIKSVIPPLARHLIEPERAPACTFSSPLYTPRKGEIYSRVASSRGVSRNQFNFGDGGYIFPASKKFEGFLS